MISYLMLGQIKKNSSFKIHTKTQKFCKLSLSSKASIFSFHNEIITNILNKVQNEVSGVHF